MPPVSEGRDIPKAIPAPANTCRAWRHVKSHAAASASHLLPEAGTSPNALKCAAAATCRWASQNLYTHVAADNEVAYRLYVGCGFQELSSDAKFGQELSLGETAGARPLCTDLYVDHIMLSYRHVHAGMYNNNAWISSKSQLLAVFRAGDEPG